MSWASPESTSGGSSSSSWASTSDLHAETEPLEFESAQSPVWLLALGGALDLVGVMLLIFWGLGGAIGAYVSAFAAFGCILLFRRRDNVLRQTSWVLAIPGLRLWVPALMVATIALMIAAVYPIATELSRGA